MIAWLVRLAEQINLRDYHLSRLQSDRQTNEVILNIDVDVDVDVQGNRGLLPLITRLSECLQGQIRPPLPLQ